MSNIIEVWNKGKKKEEGFWEFVEFSNLPIGSLSGLCASLADSTPNHCFRAVEIKTIYSTDENGIRKFEEPATRIITIIVPPIITTEFYPKLKL